MEAGTYFLDRGGSQPNAIDDVQVASLSFDVLLYSTSIIKQALHHYSCHIC